MVPPIDSFIEEPTRTRVRVGLAPVQNAVHSLLLLSKTKELSGLGDWVVNTAHQLSPEDRKQHYRVMIAFYHAITPEQRWSSFPVYIQHLSNMDAEALRDKMIRSYFSLSLREASENFTPKTVVANEENYIAFLKERFGDTHIDEELERWAYGYVINPPAMQELIVSHLQYYWDNYLAKEWERTLPLLKKAVKAFQLVDFNQMDDREAIEYIAGQSPEEHWQNKCKDSENLYFAPSLHVGPYLGKFYEENLFGIIFGARLPDNAPIHAPELSQAEIYVRLNALADETRLRILKHVGDQGESCSTEIIETLGLSQSATSRHLTQLTAAGYLRTRRIDGAKCYKLDKDRIANTMDTVKAFLLS
ncbi:MAG: winged helix-turn-helix transcriptional regulator [Anaerolineae bacterium]|jgi:DNA-binding transcriptional ArsR family regulator|nr:winged helix-turn-helix transcriptional regulator [Anaerolineae bacterium]MBT3712446.1 winged helix-turn-helix transcriptional regulator [Anaerolineae bacterium]MBT4309986.1 winged helix-turn-helix transcriptional regulator [Anaerolineae bacterium]MBT4457052.1 winged helix-turn-helix transcriptional regulator [Anaerolineae bacterium]MBT6059729.1 winged helix-turn-helix transcriptional regulator [Anaerolineae bacterium]